MTISKRLASAVLCVGVLTGSSEHGRADEAAEAILSAAGMNAGLIVHLGCRDGAMTLALSPGGKFVVQNPHVPWEE